MLTQYKMILYAKKKDGKICAYELCLSICSKEEQQAQNVVDYFSSIHNISFTIKRNKGLFSVRCGTKAARKFIDLVKPYVTLECMKYKVMIGKGNF